MTLLHSPVHGYWCGSRVFPIKCKYCGDRIYLFTCNCGCRVLFDELGIPWPLHLCAQHLISEYGFTRQQVDSLVKRRAEELSLPIPKIDDLFSEKVSKHKAWEAPIIKVIPEEKKKKKVFGIIRDVIHCVDPFKKLHLQKCTIGGDQLTKYLPNNIIQITVHSGLIGESQIESYTIWLDEIKYSDMDLQKDRIVSIELNPVYLIGCDPFWIGVALSFID